jgi:hypothetical protein
VPQRDEIAGQPALNDVEVEIDSEVDDNGDSDVDVERGVLGECVLVPFVADVRLEVPLVSLSS